MSRRKALPKDPSQRAKAILDMATGEHPQGEPQELTEAQKFAQAGGLKGGVARAQSLSSKRRKEIAKIAAGKRWAKTSGRGGRKGKES